MVMRVLPSVTFILAEGFETAECGLILSPHLNEEGVAHPTWHSLLLDSVLCPIE